ncbi:MAG: hypothetical protein GWP08_03495 [Nitrospiraceae bacterium]|nr:hypothetical protein [Nitrospiraceae bacterium]
MLSKMISLCVLMAVGAAVGELDGLKETVFIRLDGEALPPNMTQNNTEATMVPYGGRRAMQVDFARVDWPNVFFAPPEGTWDWSAYAGIAVDVFNPGTETVDVCMRVDNAGADGMNHCNNGTVYVKPGERATLMVRFSTGEANDFWGMRGVPYRGVVGTGSPIDTSAITAFQVFLPRPPEPRTLILEEVRLFGDGQPLRDLIPLPFIDRFGQYMHADWPGKIASEEDLRQRRDAEKAALAGAPALAGRDGYGGWADGPQLEATGWFRTEQIDGTWWLVTPSGHLFFSVGMDCVGTWGETFVEGRDGWFEALPDADNPAERGMYGQVEGAHSMAEPIGGKGRTCRFYQWNLLRKYGEDWPRAWRNTTYRRLGAWGFNTIANWSQEDVLLNSPMPFVVSLSISGEVRELEGARGYWGRMKDVYDPAFAEVVDARVASGVKKYAANPLCIGYFVDNELSWETVRHGTLASPPGQPCRQAFVEQLQAKYETIGGLNAAWGTEAADWDALRVPEKANAACGVDLDAFEYAFAHRYFRVVSDALKKHTPHQLYLGCRFSSAPKRVVRACADVADVVSFNLYSRRIKTEAYTGENDLGKPLIIGEFHFGALDRGMFHTGLVPTNDQADRAAHYLDYVRYVADCPAFVGCHWFQYVDEHTTGRWFDGENYNIGFVSITDTPYSELVTAAKRAHSELYARHSAKPPNDR